MRADADRPADALDRPSEDRAAARTARSDPEPAAMGLPGRLFARLFGASDGSNAAPSAREGGEESLANRSRVSSSSSTSALSSAAKPRGRGASGDAEPWFNPEAFTAEKRQWLAQRRRRRAAEEARTAEAEKKENAEGLGPAEDRTLEGKAVDEGPKEASADEKTGAVRGGREPLPRKKKRVFPFERFYVVGLPPDADVAAVAESVRREKTGNQREREKPVNAVRGAGGGGRVKPHRGVPGPTYPAKVLFSYPPVSAADPSRSSNASSSASDDNPCRLDDGDVAAFCFPHGVEPAVLERTPSMSAMHDVVYGQRHLHAEDASFVFRVERGDPGGGGGGGEGSRGERAEDDARAAGGEAEEEDDDAGAPGGGGGVAYGVCCRVRELVSAEPAMVSAARRAMAAGRGPRGGRRGERRGNEDEEDAGSNPAGAGGGSRSGPGFRKSRYLVAADRCYCFLSETPFFSLHFEVMHAILGMERLERIRASVEKMGLLGDEDSDEDEEGGGAEEEREEEEAEREEEAAEEEAAESESAAERSSANPDRPRGSSDSVSPLVGRKLSFEDDPDPAGSGPGPGPPARHSLDLVTLDASLAAASESLRVLTQYRAARLPPPGETMAFAPLKDIKPITFVRRATFASARAEGEGEETVTRISRETTTTKGNDGGGGGPRTTTTTTTGGLPHALASAEASDEASDSESGARDEPTWLSPSASRLSSGRTYVSASIRRWEEAAYLDTWTTVAICRALSLENALTLFAATLLERRIAIFSPNLGEASAVVLGVTGAALRPLRWQSLSLPVTPESMFGFLDAPVPFVLGVQRKTSEARRATSGLVRVNAYKDSVRVRGGVLPPLPGFKRLAETLRPLHRAVRDAARRAELRAGRGPVARPSEAARGAARAFADAWRAYLGELLNPETLRGCAITDVNDRNERVSILLKESFVDSFAAKDGRSFVRQLAETQMFETYADETLRG